MGMPSGVILGNGKAVSIGAYVRAIQIAKANPSATFKHGLTGWWPVTGAEIVQQFSAGVQERINQRGGLVMREPNRSRIQRALVERVTVECRWCGSSMAYVARERRFCSGSCRRDHYH
jgi:hypothetical protein